MSRFCKFGKLHVTKGNVDNPILDTKFIISQIGKQCKPVQVHSFSRFSLRCNLRKFACWGSIPNPL